MKPIKRVAISTGEDKAFLLWKYCVARASRIKGKQTKLDSKKNDHSSFRLFLRCRKWKQDIFIKNNSLPLHRPTFHQFKEVSTELFLSLLDRKPSYLIHKPTGISGTPCCQCRTIELFGEVNKPTYYTNEHMLKLSVCT